MSDLDVAIVFEPTQVCLVKKSVVEGDAKLFLRLHCDGAQSFKDDARFFVSTLGIGVISS